MMKNFKDCFCRHRRAWFMALGSMSVFFLFGTMCLIPLYDGKTVVEIISDMMNGVEKQTTVGDEPPIVEPFIYEYFFAPSNSFGMGDTVFKTVNWSFFDTCFSYEKLFENSSSDYELEIEYNETNNSGVRKYKYKLKTDDAGYYGLNIIFDPQYNVYMFFESNYTFVVSYPDGDIVYNFTDIVDSLDGDINYYVSGDIFYLELGKYLESAVEFEIDPILGSTITYQLEKNIEDAIYGGYFQMGATGGIGENITVALSNTFATKDVKCALYNADNSLVLNGVTDERAIGVVTASWEGFIFSGTKPLLFANAWYWICVWSESNTGLCQLSYASSGTVKLHFDNEVYNGFPDPWADGTSDDTASVSIYCSYTSDYINNAPTITNPNPAMDDLNKTVGTVTCNATITDDDSNQSTVDFYTSTDNSSFIWVQTNNTVLNESVEFDYTTTSYQTIYYWKVTANDTHDNTTSDIYNFETTPYHTLFFNDTFPTENWIDNSNNMTDPFESGWENFTYTTSGGALSTSWYDSFEGNAHQTVVATVPATYWNDGGEEESWWYGDGYTTSSSTGCGVTGDRNPVHGTDIVFTEGSTTPLGAPPALYSLESDAFTIASYENASVNFYYHMYGLDTAFDYCYVQIDDGEGGWDTLWQLDAVSHSGYASADWWDEATAYSDDGSNAPYTGSHKFRFLVNLLTAYTGDFSLDAVWINVTGKTGISDAWILSDEIFLPDTYSWDTFDAYVNQTLSCSFALVDPDDYNHNITSGLVGNGDDISSVTNASVMIFGNFSDDSVNMASWNISWTSEEEEPGDEWQTIKEWNLTISNVTAEFQQISEWNLTISDTSINTTISEWNLTISDTSVNQTISTWNLTISDTGVNTTISEWNLTLRTNHIPYYISHSPGNGSTGVSLTPQVFVDIDDPDANPGSLSVSFFSSSDGVTYYFQQFSDGHNHDQLVSWFPSGLESDTTYWWKVYIDDGFDNASYWFSFTTTKVWTTTTTWNLTISDSSINQTISEWNLTISDSGADTTISEWNLTIRNVSGGTFQTIKEWNLTISDTGVNTTIVEWNLTISDSGTDTQIVEWNLTISSVTAEFQQISEWNLTITNDTVDAWYTISTWNLTISSVTAEFQQISEWNLTISNTTPLINIQITLENPTNETSIPTIIPSIYFTLQALDGSTMNYTIYWGETQNNLTTNISYGGLVSNGTYYHSFSNASSNETTYYWSVNATDGTIWVNESYSFTTRYERGATGNRMGLTSSIFAIALITFVMVLFILFNKKKKNNN